MTFVPTAPEPEAWRARLYDMPELVAKHRPLDAATWRVHPLVIPETLAIVAGKGGAGKTWVMHEAAHAVATGTTRAGLRGKQGTALIIDAEMGEWLTVDRFASCGYSTDIQVFNAQGLDLTQPEDRQLVFSVIDGLKPDFVGFDSLRALTPGSHENDSDDMGPMVNWIRKVVSQQRTSGLLIHHAGWKEDRTRGSSAIKDRVDAVWYLSSADGEGRQKLSCHGPDLKAPRWCRPPDDLWVRIREAGGLESCDAAPPSAREVPLDGRILGALNGSALTRPQIEEALNYKSSNKGVRAEIKRMVAGGQLNEVGGAISRNEDYEPPPGI